MNSQAHGRSPAPNTAMAPSMEAARPAKPTRTELEASGRGMSLTVARVISPSLPSAPTNRRFRSRPTTSFWARPPMVSTLPPGITASTPSTQSRVTPYLTARRPPAQVEMFPPMVDIFTLAGSGG